MELYYPFGLGMKGLDWTLNTSKENKWQYNGGVEKNTDFDLNWYETDYRNLDIQTSRFVQVDPKSEHGGQESLTPYQYAFNNPTRYNDPDGDCPDCPTNNSNLPVPSDPSKPVPSHTPSEWLGLGAKAVSEFLSYITSEFKVEAKQSKGKQYGGEFPIGPLEVGIVISHNVKEMASVKIDKKSGDVLPKIEVFHDGKSIKNGEVVERVTSEYKIGLGIVSFGYSNQKDKSIETNKVLEFKSKWTLKVLGVERESETTRSRDKNYEPDKKVSWNVSASFQANIINGFKFSIKKKIQ